MNGYPIYPAEPPKVWKWYKVYCIAMAVLYLLCAAAGVFLMLADPQLLKMEPFEAKIQGVFLMLLGIVLVIPFAAAPFLPVKSWHWIYGLVMICIGLTSCCCLPASVPLLIFWIKPETKVFFGRT